MYVYYRAMALKEFQKTFMEEVDYTGSQGSTYWADSASVASRYMSPNRVLVELTLDRPINPDYRGVAIGVDLKGYCNNHIEYRMPKVYFQSNVLPNLLEVSYHA